MEVGVKENVKKILVKSRLKCVDHEERMGDEQLAERESMPGKWMGKRKRGRPKFQMENCIKR